MFAAGDFTKKYNAVHSGQPAANPQKEFGLSSFKDLRKYEGRINLGALQFSVSALSQNSFSSLDSVTRRSGVRIKDKADRATSEQVLDPRTRMILFKLMNRGLLTQVNGCVSTGKEANVYYATAPDEQCAIKIYKTSILVFKDRDRYVSGEFRFRHGYARHNPRKMVRLWAEKEMRNLSRLHTEVFATAAHATQWLQSQLHSHPGQCLCTQM